KGALEIFNEPLVADRNLNAGRAALPYSHEPHGVDAKGFDVVPLLFRNRAETYRLLVFPAEFTQPDPGVDFVDDGIFRPSCHVPLGSLLEGRPLTPLQHDLRIQQTVELDGFGHQSSPPCLMTCAKPGSIVSMEVFVKENVITPQRVILEFFRATIDGAFPLLIAKEDSAEPICDLLAHFKEI